jgi:hypothetical protein
MRAWGDRWRNRAGWSASVDASVCGQRLQLRRGGWPVADGSAFYFRVGAVWATGRILAIAKPCFARASYAAAGRFRPRRSGLVLVGSVACSGMPLG